MTLALLTRLNRPGGNVTGMSSLAGELTTQCSHPLDRLTVFATLALLRSGGRRKSLYRMLHIGAGRRALPVATSSGQTMTCLPSCHWIVTAL